MNLYIFHLGVQLPLSALRLLVSPVKIVSAAIWQIIEHRVVADYGTLEDFVSMVTDVVPELLTNCQRTQLVLGLRAQVRWSVQNEHASAY